MAVADGLNPSFGGIPTADGFKTRSGAAMTKVVTTNGTTAVNVFGTTNGFKGSIVSIRTIARDATAANITVKSGTPTKSPFGSRTVCVIAKSTSPGGVVGSAIGLYSNGGFIAAGTVTVVSSSAVGDALVEVVFVPHTP